MTNKHRYKKEMLHMLGDEHMTAQTLHNKMKKIYPNIGLGTVYRNLNELVVESMIMKTSGVLEHTIYEKIKAPHGHIVCRSHNRIYDITVENLNIKELHLPENFSLDEISICFYGSFHGGFGKCTAKIEA